jgi:hypothetical protein
MHVLLRFLLLTPLYHLLIAGPSRQCSRWHFFMAIIWLGTLGQVFLSILSGVYSSVIRSAGFPLEAAGQTHCRWQMILSAAEPPFQQHVLGYVEANAALLENLHRGMWFLGLFLTMFLCWRVLMLVIQRANNTHLSATVLVCVTIALAVATYIDPLSRPHDSFFKYAFVAWLLFLAFFPPHQPVEWVSVSQKPSLRIFEKAWYHAFSASLEVHASTLMFVMGVVLITVISALFLYVTNYYARMIIFAGYDYPLFSIDEILCSLGVMGNSKSTLAMGFRDLLTPYLQGAYLPVNSLFVTLILFYPLAFVYIAIREFSLLVQRFNHLRYPHPFIWASAALVLILGINGVIRTIHSNDLYSYAWYIAGFGVIALLRPLKGASA